MTPDFSSVTIVFVVLCISRNTLKTSQVLYFLKACVNVSMNLTRAWHVFFEG
nr:hypothetical protein [Tanacetum cinerariifolium]